MYCLGDETATMGDGGERESVSSLYSNGLIKSTSCRCEMRGQRRYYARPRHGSLSLSLLPFNKINWPVPCLRAYVTGDS